MMLSTNTTVEEEKMAYFNYRNLDSTEFEALAKDVMERLLGRSLFRYGQGKDGGIDLCDDIREKHVVVQCKKYQQGSFDNLYNVLKRYEKPKIDELNPRPEQYYVFTSIELLPQQKQKILDLFQDYMEGESWIVDGIAINDFFRDERNHDLISRNIKLFLSFPENYKYSPSDLSQMEANRLYERLFSIFENDRKNHPSIKMMDPDPLLFPKGLPEILSDGRLAVEEEEDPRAIKDMILDSWKHEDRRHILLIGEGGIGKTVAMLTLPVEDWFKEFGIPVIYVPLQRLDTYEGDLNRYIKEKIGSGDYERCIDLANRASEGHPGLLLLLDGFNEIPDKFKKKAEQYIREWMEKPGAQIITTSRLGLFLEDDFSKYRLKPLTYDTVRSFLLSAGIAEEQLPGQKDRIWGVINVPLMLTMYTQIEKVRETTDRSSAASILEWKEPENAAHIIWDYLQMELYRCIKKADSTYSIMQYAAAVFAVAPYICSEMSRQNKFYIKREEFHKLIQGALIFYADHRDMPSKQILKLCRKYDPYHKEDLFHKESMEKYARIFIDNMALFQEQETIKEGCDGEYEIDYYCSLMHQNFRDALAAFYICSCLPKVCGAKEKRELLNQADYYVKDYMAEFLSDRELVSIWDRHRKEEPEDGIITFILMDLIGRQKNYDYRELDFSNIDLTKTNLHSLLSRRLDICPLPGDRDKLSNTIISIDCLSPNGHAGRVKSVAYSPNGRQLASSASDRTVRIRDLESGVYHVLEGNTDGGNSLTYSLDGRKLASGASDSTVRIWNLVSGERRVLEGHTGRVNSVAFTWDGRKLASDSDDRTVRIWDLESGESRVLEGHAGRVMSVAYSPDGRQVASGADDKTVRIWNLSNDNSRVLVGHAGRVNSVALSPDGRQLASGSSDSTVCIWDLESDESRVLVGHAEVVNSVAFSPDGRQLASGASDKTVRIWDLESGESRVLKGHAGWVMSVAYSPDRRQLASGLSDMSVWIWDLVSGESRVLVGCAGWVNSVAYSPDGRHLASGSEDRTVRIWDLDSGESHALEGHAGAVSSVAFSHDGRRLASGADDKTVRIWNLSNDNSRVLVGHAGRVNSVALSPDGRQLASGSDDRTVRIWDLESDESRVLVGHEGWVRSVAYSPDGRQLASGADDKTVRIWDLESDESHVLEGHTGVVSSVAYSPDGRQLASGAEDRTVRIWNLASGESRILEGHVGWVNNVAFSHDGRRLASGADDKTVRIWDLESGESRVLLGHAGWVNSVVFSLDGRNVASGADDKTVRIWDLEKYQEVKKYTIITHINLSGANFELAIIDEKDKEMLRAAGAKV